MPPRSDIEAMDRPTVLYVIYRMVCAQQPNLSACYHLLYVYTVSVVTVPELSWL